MFRFKVMPDDAEPFVVEAMTRDIYRWEKVTKGAGFNKLKDEMRTEDLYAVAYFASTRHDLFTGTLADFRETCDFDILPDEDDDQGDGEPDPTPPVPSRGKSSRSRS